MDDLPQKPRDCDVLLMPILFIAVKGIEDGNCLDLHCDVFYCPVGGVRVL